jgi:hypothetical protein
VLYWYVWTILLPSWGRYELEEVTDILGDGTTVTKLVRKPLESDDADGLENQRSGV